MMPKADHRRLFGLLICAVAILFGCKKADPTGQSVSGGDPKSQIYKHLAKKSGQKEFAPGIDLDLPKRVAMLRSNANVLEQRTTALRASLRAADDGQTPLQKDIERLRGEIAKAKQDAGAARTRLNEAESREPKDANEIAARRKERATAEAAWTAKREEFSGKEAQLEVERATRKQKHASLESELQEAERAWEVARMEAARKQEELSNQEDTYIRSVRQQVSGVRSYEALYRIVGQQLATADRLLADPDILRRRMGLKMAREACGHVNSGAVDVWLAARICEAYFWPNLDLADAQPGSRERALDLLETSRRVFFDTYETNSVLTNYNLLMANAPNARAADTFRVQVADWLEEKGNLKHAAQILNEIRDAEVLASAQERITRVREGVAASP
jgi:hypothetical protein